jgi:hypothetical protein
VACLVASYPPIPGRPSAVRLACFGLSAAILVHGLVDYLLAFTGHYLFLGFLIGGSPPARIGPDLTGVGLRIPARAGGNP